MSELKGKEYLKRILNMKQGRIKERYKFYDMKHTVRDLNISTPPSLNYFQETLGWCAKSVDSLADRLQFKEFRNDNFNLTEIFEMNNSDVLFDSAILGALISSCDFIYVSADEQGFPRLQVIDGFNATGIINPITRFLDEGYAVLERDSDGNVLLEAYFTPDNTVFYQKGEKRELVINNPSKYVALVPIVYRPDAARPFGHSRITRAAMDYQRAAIRTIKRSEISAEYYSYPQKYATGLSEDAEIDDKWKASMSTMLTFTKDEDGDRPTIGQFQAASMTPHIEQLKMFASLFGGEAGLTLDDLGFSTGNPSSSDAIKAAHEPLRLAARKAQRIFGTGFINTGIVAASIRDDFAYDRKAFYNTKCIWYPVFEPDGSALSGIGDAAIKINQSIPNFFDSETLSDFTGIDGAK